MLKAIAMNKLEQLNQPIAKMNVRHSFIPTCLDAEVYSDTNKLSYRGWFGLFQFGRLSKGDTMRFVNQKFQ